MDVSQPDAPGGPGCAALAWYGNAAKMRVIQRVTADRSPKVVFDYGAGRGAGWAETLRLHPEITLVAYEPDPASAQAFRRAVPGALVFDGNAAAIETRADVIVSFSVFEHVADRTGYLAHAVRALKRGGRFFLNYDDGHFRHPGSLLDALRNRAAPILPHVGLTRHYQSTVRKPDADRMIAEAGLAVADDRYENLEGMKELSKTIDPARRAAFAQTWLDLEDRLNADFRRQVSEPFNGDPTNLWREMASRTLELTTN